MKPSKKQKEVIKMLVANDGRITISQLVENRIINTYYYNERKHIGDLMSRMCNNGMVSREKPGVFLLNKKTHLKKKKKGINEDSNQGSFF